MAVLCDGIGQQHGEGNVALQEQHHENEMRAGDREEPDAHGNKQQQPLGPGVVLHDSLQIHKMVEDTQHQKRSEGIQEQLERVLFDDVLPHVLAQVMRQPLAKRFSVVFRSFVPMLLMDDKIVIFECNHLVFRNFQQYKSNYKSDGEENAGQDERLFRAFGGEKERFVAERGHHAADERPEGEQPVGEQRHHDETARAPGNRAEQTRQGQLRHGLPVQFLK